MGMIYAGILAALSVLLFLSRKEEIRAGADTPTFSRYFLKPALWLYKRYERDESDEENRKRSIRKERKGKRKGGSAWGKKKEAGLRLREELQLLYPAGAEERFRRYQVEKLSGLLLVCFAAAVIGGLIRISGGMEQRLTEDGWLRRNSYGEGEADVRLKGQVGGIEGWEQEVELTLSERRYTGQELDEMIPQVRAALEQEIQGENETLDEIRSSLSLPSQVKGYPFQITWKSGNYELIRADGTVNNEEVREKGEIVEVTAVLSYYEDIWEESFSVRVCPPVLTQEEKRERLLLEEIEKEDEAAAYEEGFWLPQQAEGEQVVWTEERSDSSLLIFLLVTGMGIVQYRFMDDDLRKRLEKRERQLLLSYPEFISKLTLLMGAGLPVRAAFMRMASDYQKKKSNGTNYVYEELLLACREMESGITEIEAYEHFGLRCRLPQYRKCVTLLVQNLKKGSAGLLAALQEEAQNSFEERKRNAREEGERAGTRLLLPMMMMLAVVMVLILVPACFSFAGM